MMAADPPPVSGPVSGVTWPDLSGRLERDQAGLRHRLPVRVYFEDTDASGLAYHASYVRWCERGRTDFLRLLGHDHRAMMAGPLAGHTAPATAEAAAFVVRRMTLEFLKPARMDEALEVETRVGEMSGARLNLAQEISRDGVRLFEASVLVVLLGASGRPQRLDSRMRERLASPPPA